MHTPGITGSIDRFPESPGVYIMKDAAGKILYIGKAVNLRSRVRSYFAGDHEDRPHIPFMLAKLHGIDWIATNTDSEALILEANMIRSHKPPYNIDLKDDKHYPYLKVTLTEPFPRLRIARRVADDGSAYFGPYTDSPAMRRIMNYAQRIFKICTCTLKLPLSRPVRPCINYSLGRCSAPCAGKITEAGYRANIDGLIQFLKGRRNELLADLRQKMTEASAGMEFERAATYRDQVRLIASASNSQRVDLKLPDGDRDIFGLTAGDRNICMAVLHFREGLLINKRHYLFKRDIWEMPGESHDHLVVQFYLHTSQDRPGEVLLSDNAGFDAPGLQSWFDSQEGPRIAVGIPQKGAKRQLVEMAEKNARLYLAERAPEQPDRDLADLQEALRLPEIPASIEAFDISNLGDRFAVAGMVRFVNGRPEKSGYRRYKIKTVEGQDDFAMMMEVVGRRMKRADAEGKKPADLFLIDGGLGQLHAAQKALDSYTHKPMIVSLAKQEEIVFSPYAEQPVRLPATHPGRKLLERVRNEVHRYAITYHRLLRGRQFGRSSLEQMPGIGPKTARSLIRAFGSVARLKAASAEEIAKVRGCSIESAMKLKEMVGGGGKTENRIPNTEYRIQNTEFRIQNSE